MLTIRLQRSGKKNQPEFRIVLAQKTAAVNKKFLEVLGNYNPRTKDFVVKNEERLKYWISQHVTISPTVHNLLVTKNLLDAPKVKAFSTPKKPVEPVAEEKPVQAEEVSESSSEAESASTEVIAEAPTETESQKQTTQPVDNQEKPDEKEANKE